MNRLDSCSVNHPNSRSVNRLVYLIVVSLALHVSALAHEARPVTVHITEHVAGHVVAQWHVPKVAMLAQAPQLKLPQGFTPVEAPTRIDRGDAISYFVEYRDGPSIANAEITMDYGTVNPGLRTFYRIELADGAIHTRLMSVGEHNYQIPAQESAWGVAKNYGELGVAHIWGGVDHLLFIICLLLVAGTLRRTLLTITGFTLGHAITISAATLGYVGAPTTLIEAAIALSIAVIAAEILREDRDTLLYRFPVIVSIGFGLLHGLGFASALAEIGLPQTQLPAALLSFNLGVEIGQLLFAALVYTLWTTLQGQMPPHSDRRLAYGTGAIAAFWTIERTLAFAG